ncbi:MAG: hypothetical protein WCW14_02655 [Candidatus Paceibacterota bacterium]
MKSFESPKESIEDMALRWLEENDNLKFANKWLNKEAANSVKGILYVLWNEGNGEEDVLIVHQEDKGTTPAIINGYVTSVEIVSPEKARDIISERANSALPIPSSVDEVIKLLNFSAEKKSAFGE